MITLKKRLLAAGLTVAMLFAGLTVAAAPICTAAHADGEDNGEITEEAVETVWQTRTEALAEYNAFAAAHITRYNGDALSGLFAAAQDDILQAETDGEIAEALAEAKLNLLHVWANSELDYYKTNYATKYDLKIEEQRAKVDAAETAEEVDAAIVEARATFHSQAQATAISGLVKFVGKYPSYDNRESSEVKTKIDAALSVEEVDEVFAPYMKKVEGFLAELEAAKDSAKTMLALYARDLGAQDLGETKAAIATINDAVSMVDIDVRFSEAKRAIEKAAGAEDGRVGTVNAGLIVGIALLGAVAAGLAAAITVIVLRYDKQKNVTVSEGAVEHEQAEPTETVESIQAEPIDTEEGEQVSEPIQTDPAPEEPIGEEPQAEFIPEAKAEPEEDAE